MEGLSGLRLRIDQISKGTVVDVEYKTGNEHIYFITTFMDNHTINANFLQSQIDYEDPQVTVKTIAELAKALRTTYVDNLTSLI